jgi:hypothetical protein
MISPLWGVDGDLDGLGGKTRQRGYPADLDGVGGGGAAWITETGSSPSGLFLSRSKICCQGRSAPRHGSARVQVNFFGVDVEMLMEQVQNAHRSSIKAASRTALPVT